MKWKKTRRKTTAKRFRTYCRYMEFRLRNGTKYRWLYCRSWLPGRRLFLKKFPIRQSGFLRPKSQHFSPFREKCLLDNTTGICYQNPNCHLLDDDCHFFPSPLDIGLHSVTAHYLRFSLISLSKREFLSLSLHFGAYSGEISVSHFWSVY